MAPGSALKKILTYFGMLACLQIDTCNPALMCCHQVYSNNSVAYRLSQAPDPNCTTQWILNKTVIVDENGDVDNKNVLHHEEKGVLLKNNTPGVLYRFECLRTGVPKQFNCTDPCDSEGAGDQTIWKTVLAVLAAVFVFSFSVYICKRRAACCKKPKHAANRIPQEESQPPA